MNNSITSKEKALLKLIASSEYGDGPGDTIWLDYVVDSKSKGGVLTSLKKKGLVEFTLVAKENSDNWRDGHITDSTINLTEKGCKAINVKHYNS
jgi:secreted Zn-dependent insulinase-like peptidase